MCVMFFGDFDVMMTQNFRNSINVDAGHDKVAGEGGAEHFDVGVDAGFLGVAEDFRANVAFNSSS